MRLRIAVWVTASAVGAVLLAIPDEGDRLVGFSEAHGLTLIDCVAVSVLIVGLIVASAFADFAAWWAVGALLLASIQLAALLALGRS